MVAAGCTFAGTSLVTAALANQVEAPHRAHAIAVGSSVRPSGPSPAALPPSPPIAVSVPSIGIGAVVGELGRNADGTVQVPSQPMQAGWYRHSPAPGSLGPAVLLGHVDDDRTGPAIFFRLAELQPGAVVNVTRADGRTVVFTVDQVREVPKAPFPTADVYGNTDHPALRLITCADWDHAAHAYRGNTVVFAHLTGVL